MACPSCGSTAREPIAPGYWLCTGMVEESFGGPGLTGYQSGPPVISRSRPCGTRYAEGAGAATASSKCACGTYSIGECTTCGAAVCGDHSRLLYGRRRCGNCIHAENAARERADTDARLEKRRLEKEASDRARRDREFRAAEYAALPVMDLPNLAAFLEGRIDDGPMSGFRLPERLTGPDLQAVLRLIPPTVTVVTATFMRFRLGSRPAWRVGTQSHSHGRSSYGGAGISFFPVVIFDDGTTMTVGQLDGHWSPMSSLPRPRPWAGDTASIRAFRSSIQQGMSVPAFESTE